MNEKERTVSVGSGDLLGLFSSSGELAEEAAKSRKSEHNDQQSSADKNNLNAHAPLRLTGLDL
jgi:hypothetical protein